MERIVSDTVSIDEIPSIMQAMGFYPSKQEIYDMINEVKYGKISDGGTVPVTDINLDDLIKCKVFFINLTANNFSVFKS